MKKKSDGALQMAEAMHIIKENSELARLYLQVKLMDIDMTGPNVVEISPPAASYIKSVLFAQQDLLERLYEFWAFVGDVIPPFEGQEE